MGRGSKVAQSAVADTLRLGDRAISNRWPRVTASRILRSVTRPARVWKVRRNPCLVPKVGASREIGNAGLERSRSRTKLSCPLDLRKKKVIGLHNREHSVVAGGHSVGSFGIRTGLLPCLSSPSCSPPAWSRNQEIIRSRAWVHRSRTRETGLDRSIASTTVYARTNNAAVRAAVGHERGRFEGGLGPPASGVTGAGTRG